MKTLGALTVRKKFGSVLDEVANKKIHIAITRVNNPLVVMLPIDDYEKMMSVEKERKMRLGQVADKLNNWRLLHKDNLKGMDSTAIIREMRENR